MRRNYLVPSYLFQDGTTAVTVKRWTDKGMEEKKGKDECNNN